MHCFVFRYFSNDLDLERIGGYVRISFVHYNSVEDAARAAEIVRKVAEQGPTQ